MFTIYDFKTEHLKNPLGLDVKAPSFSWKLRSTNENLIQKCYRLKVQKGEETVWDTGIVQSDQSINIIYQGAELLPATRYEVQLEVTDNKSETDIHTGWFETGLMDHKNFKGSFITHSFDDDLEPCAIFTKTFRLTENPVVSARLYISALGIYDLKLNDKKISNICFAPGWTNYKERLQYQTYDITSFLKEENFLEVTVGNGWYKGILGFHGRGDHYGKRTAIIGQVEVTYEDGHKDYIFTDNSWMNTLGKHRYSDIYNGEVIDHTFVSPKALAAVEYYYDKNILIGQESEPVKVIQRVEGKKLIITPKGEVVIDFGQNLVGVVEAKVNLPKGTRITIEHAEALDENGNFYTDNLRTAKATDRFICSGEDDVFCPKFTFHGFRYIRIQGIGNDPNIKNFTALVIHTELEATGVFETDNEQVNQLWSNIKWTLKGNFLDIPTDCPQRDERLGYTGDAQMFLPTAAFIKNVSLFFRKWLRDLKTEQTLEYGVPMAIPNILGSSTGIAIWHDAATIVPWKIWETYGDLRVLKEQYDSMKDCVEFTKSTVAKNGLLQSGMQLGDWVALDMEKGPMRKQTDEVLNLTPEEKTSSTDVYFIANIFYAHSVDLLVKAARLLGNKQDAKKYEELYHSIVKSFREEYITKTGRLISETQTGCVLALHFNMIEEKDRKRVIDTLIDNLKKHKNYLTTGFIGTQYLCHVLSENGQHEIAGKLLLNEDCPSWLYSVNLGATTVWELWDGVNPDGSFNKYEMNSLNQYAFASIGDWMHKQLGGIHMVEPGYKKSRIAPRLITGITSMKTQLETVYGELSCNISCKNKKFIIDINIPVNTTSILNLPEKEEMVVGSGTYHFEYDTKLSYEKEPYTMDMKLGELIEHPLGNKMLMEYAPELMENEMFIQFAVEKTILDINSVMPQEAMDLFTMILNTLNEEEKSTM